MFVSFVITFDFLCDSQKHDEWQVECMHRVTNIKYSPNPEVYLRNLLSQSNARVGKPCEWKGIICERKSIVEIEWDPSKYEEENRLSMDLVSSLQWIPNSIRVLDLSNQRINCFLEAQLLPRNLKVCRLNSCNLRGSFNTDMLPSMIEEFYCRDNLLSGKVVMIRIPNTLRRLDLSGNDEIQISISNDCLRNMQCDFGRMNNYNKFFSTIEGEELDRKVLRGLLRRECS